MNDNKYYGTFKPEMSSIELGRLFFSTIMRVPEEDYDDIYAAWSRADEIAMTREANMNTDTHLVLI